MTDFNKSFAVALALCVAALPAFADDATAPATPAPAATAPATGADATGAAAPAKPADGPGSTYIAKTFDDWQIQCFHAQPGGVDPCQMYQLMKDDKGTAVADISMLPLPPNGKAVTGATIMTPLETLLTQNIVLKVDSNDPKMYPFTFCAPMGCFARVGLTADELATFKKGTSVALTVVPVAAPDHPVSVKISLKGFSSAYDYVTKNAADVAAAAGKAAPAAAPAPAPVQGLAPAPKK